MIGQTISHLFRADRELKRVSVDGGDPIA